MADDIRRIAEAALEDAGRGTIDGEDRRIIESRTREPELARFALAVLDALGEWSPAIREDWLATIARNLEARRGR